MLCLALIGSAEATAAYSRVARRLGGGTRVVLQEDPVSWGGAFDAVVLCVPVQDRAALCRQAAAAGKHVLVENPLALSAAAAAEAINACNKAGVRLMVAQAFRYLPALQVIRASLEAGKLGAPGLLRIH